MSWASPETFEFLGSVQPMTASEDVAPAERLVSRWLLVTAGVPDIVATDRVRRDDGTVLEVDGDVGVWRDPRGAPHHVEAVLKKVTG